MQAHPASGAVRFVLKDHLIDVLQVDPSDPHPTEGEPASHAGDETVAPAAPPADRSPAERPVRVDPHAPSARADAAATPPPMPLA